MKAKDILLGVLGIAFVSMGLFSFVSAMANTYGVDMSRSNFHIDTFNKTEEVYGFAQGMKKNVSELEKIPLIGDIVVLAGNAMRAMKVLWQVPTIFFNMVSELSGFGYLPSWFGDIINAMVWIVIVLIVISIGLRIDI